MEDTFFQDVESPLPNVVIQAEAHKKTNVRSEVSTVYQRITGTYETVLVIPAWEGRYHLFFDLFHQYLKTCSSPGSMVMAFIPFRVGMFSTPFPPSDLIRISFLSI